jgi:hypothetical protein
MSIDYASNETLRLTLREIQSILGMPESSSCLEITTQVKDLLELQGSAKERKIYINVRRILLSAIALIDKRIDALRCEVVISNLPGDIAGITEYKQE